MDALIPRELLFGNPERAQARLSPDGLWLSWLAPVDGVLNVFVAPVGSLGEARPITRDDSRGIREHRWTRDSARILYVQDQGGDENWHVYCADPVSHAVTDLTPGEGLHAQLLADSARQPHHIVVGLNERMPELHDWYRIDTRTGARELLMENPGFVGGVFDHDLQPRLGLAMTPDGGVSVYRFGAEAPEPMFRIAQEDSATSGPLGFTADGRYLYTLDSSGRDTGALMRHDLEAGTSEVVAVDPRVDLSEVWVHPETGAIQAVVTDFDRPRLRVLDPDIAGDVERLEQAFPGPLEVTARTADDATWLCAFSADDGPIRYALYHRGAGRVEHLFFHQPALADVPLTRRRPVIIQARDGLELVSYLSLPRWADQGGRPERPLPMVLLVHGGPWARDDWGYDAQHQLLANRGYAVLSVNFRGSTGFGKSFLNAANHEWSGKMHDDLLDAVAWAVEQGIALADQVAIMGGSYGGYATLVGLTFTPDVFACGVDIVGPSSLITLLETIPPYWAPAIAQFTSRVGTHTTEEGRAAVLEACPNPDILVNNCGGPPPGDFHDWTRDDWIKALDANMLSAIDLINKTVDGMIERKFGRVVNITSVAVKAPIAVLGLSNGARAGLTGFVAGISRQVAQHNVIMNNLLPGLFGTDRVMAPARAQAEKTGQDADEVMKGFVSQIPAGRLGDPAEFGETCAFLCSAHAGYIVGQNILMDGGQTNSTM